MRKIKPMQTPIGAAFANLCPTTFCCLIMSLYNVYITYYLIQLLLMEHNFRELNSWSIVFKSTRNFCQDLFGFAINDVELLAGWHLNYINYYQKVIKTLINIIKCILKWINFNVLTNYKFETKTAVIIWCSKGSEKWLIELIFWRLQELQQSFYVMKWLSRSTQISMQADCDLLLMMLTD